MLDIFSMLNMMQRCVSYMKEDDYTDKQIDKIMGFPVDVDPSDYIEEKWFKALDLSLRMNPETGKIYTSLEISKELYLIGDSIDRLI